LGENAARLFYLRFVYLCLLCMDQFNQ